MISPLIRFIYDVWENIMRDKIECGVFSLGIFGNWLDNFISHVHQQTDKIKMFKIDVETFANPDAFQVHGVNFPHPQVLQELSLVFERYDCIILPITPETLVWTRIALTQLQESKRFPIIALSHNVQPIAFIDMAGKGISDYIFERDNPIVLRVRLLNLLAKQKCTRHEDTGSIALSQPRTDVSTKVLSFFANLLQEEKEKEKKHHSTDNRECINTGGKIAYKETFKEAKLRVVSEFEKNYLTGALRDTNGNIGLAAQ